jgi:hypothetical protein
MARSYQQMKQPAQAHDAALKASETMSQLQQQWGADAYHRYLTRADIQSQFTQLREMLSL